MPLHLVERLHAFLHGLFWPDDAAETRALYDKVSRMFGKEHLDRPNARQLLALTMAGEVLRNFDSNAPPHQKTILTEIIEDICDYENMFVLPDVDWSERRSVTEYWLIRDELNVQRRLLEDYQETWKLLRAALILILEPLYKACPTLLNEADNGRDITVPSDLIHALPSVGTIAGKILDTVFNEDLEKAGLFLRHGERLEFNLIAASGGNPNDPKGFTKAPKLPGRSDIKGPQDLIHTYLGGTPLSSLFDQPLSFTIPTKARFEHHHIVAGSGHGKTQTLQYLICRDLKAVAAGDWMPPAHRRCTRPKAFRRPWTPTSRAWRICLSTCTEPCTIDWPIEHHSRELPSSPEYPMAISSRRLRRDQPCSASMLIVFRRLP